jgi:diguanylate cyclase (GGDEF)-like protein
MTRPQANILLVDDHPENLLALEAILSPLGENLVRADSGEAALRALLHHEFAAVLLDVRMPGMDGYETAALVKARERTRHVPIIFLTASDTDDRAARRGYGAGAVDYLFKPFDPVVLRSKVSVFIDLFHLKREAEELAHRALHDPLTGLPNRVLFHDRLALAMARTRRLPSAVGVLYVDLDGFKPVNDHLGHDHGDALLVEIAGRLSNVLRPADTVARLGGDEFAILSDAIDGARGAAEIADRVVAAIGAPFDLRGTAANVGASVGIALASEPTDPDSLLRGADQAMYEAKAAGGGRWVLHDPERRAAPVELDADLVARIDLALDAPAGWGVAVRGVGNDTVDVDALDAPSAVALLAEALGAADGSPVSVPIPVSLLFQLESAVAGALEGHRAAPHTLTIELPETALRDASDATFAGLAALAESGVRLAIRGCGIGGAGAATLARLPLTAFVLDPSLSPTAARATTALAHALGAVAVATGVDDDERLGAVRGQGCDVAQGAACGAAATGSPA